LTGTATGLFGLASAATAVNVLFIYFIHTVLLSACSILEIKKPVFLYNDMWQKIIMSQVNKLAFFSCCPLVTSLSGCGGEGMHMARGGGTHRGGGGMHMHPVHPPGYATEHDLHI
jgi:hypothetical protein